MNFQLPLGLSIRDDATFANFFPGDNARVVSYLKNLKTQASENFVYLYGSFGVGKTHLLQACCHEVGDAGHSVVYLPLGDSVLMPNVLENLEDISLVCLDDIDNVLGDSAWEEALFHFYNKAKDVGTKLLISATVTPKQLQCGLPDLQSRLTSGLAFQLVGLTDEQKRTALQMRAERRGVEMPSEVCTYLMKRYPRDMATLFDVMEMLDRASLSAKRKLTVPFVKTVLG